MARGLFFTFPAFGHLTPELAVVAELVRRGQTVHVASTERWRQEAGRAGAAFELYPHPQDAFDPSVPTSGLFEDMERLLALAEQLLPWARETIERLRPDYILLDTKAVWGRLAAAIGECPAVTMSVVFAVRPGVIPVTRWSRCCTADRRPPRAFRDCGD